MNILSIFTAIVAVIYVLLGIYFYNLNKNEILNKLLLALCICFFSWSFAYIFWYSKDMIQTQYYPMINILGATGWSFYYGIILNLSFEITGYAKKIKFLVYIPCTIMFTIYSVLRVLRIDYYSPIFSKFNIINFTVTTIYILVALVLIFKWGKTSKIYREKRQAYLIVIFGLISFILGILFQNILPLMNFPTLYIAQIVSIFWVFGIFLAISKYSFLDITSAVTIDRIMKNVNDIIVLVDNNNIITYYNDNLIKLYGNNSDKIIGKHFSDVIIYKPNSSKNNYLVNKDTEKIPVTINTEEINDDYGDVVGKLFVINDNTNFINIEKEKNNLREILLKNDISYNLLINQSHNAILVHRDGILLFANDNAAKLFGIATPGEFIGQSLLYMVPKNNRESLKEKFSMIIKKKCSSITFNDKVLKSSGVLIEVENTSSYFEYGGKPTVLTIMRDISTEKKVLQLEKDVLEKTKLLDQSLEMNKTITEYFSNVSHELKTPLNVIFSAVQTLNIYNDTTRESIIKREKYYYTMKQNCYRLTRLINNFLDISKIDSGFSKLNFRIYNIISLVENITLSVAPYVQNHGINLIFDTDIEEKLLACDPDKIEKIILNLISNAIKFTNSGGEILVTIKDGTDYITISIKDTGLGMSEDSIATIFDRFSQVDKTLKRNREGTGIGLYLVKSFIEMHNGKIQVISEPNKGSEFIISLPIRLIDSESEEESKYDINVERIQVEFSDIYS
ncbi:PAS domain-containing sensor histidine kinase [Clostridium sediminicola]|uniref:ATP-binding protein n=1 Tax=Clostridium sediminicola TaxID=3114879 RepID=UPI0031F26E60